MTIVWGIRGKIIGTVLCCVVHEYDCTTVQVVHNDTHTHEQFLKLSVDFRFTTYV